jgi:hypothetical protein
MTSRRRVALVLSFCALLALPVACGDEEAKYCEMLGKHRTAFADDGSGQTLIAGLSAFKEIAKAAPDDLTDEWQVFLDALETLDQKLDAADIKPTDVVEGKQPEGVSDADWAAVQAAANNLGTPAVADALNGIDQQGKDVCKVQLGL